MTQFRPSRFEILPTVIKNLLIINVLFFLAQKTFGNSAGFDLDVLLGIHHVKSQLFQPWQLVSYLFLHGSIMHLFANMLGLWMFGSTLEGMWGPKRFLTFYFLCGIGAGLIQLVSLWFQYHELLVDFVALNNNQNVESITYFAKKHPEYLAGAGNTEGGVSVGSALSAITRNVQSVIDNPTIGASGAIFGILAAFIYLFPNTEIYLYFLFPIKAKWIGLGYFAYEMISAVQNSPTDNVAHWAHLGGGLVGFLLILTWNKKNRQNFY